MGNEFIPMPSKVSAPSPPSSLDGHKFEPPGATVELPKIPSLEKLPPIPLESPVSSLPLDMPLPSPPPIGFNGRPQIPAVQQKSHNVTVEMPSGSQDPLTPLSPAKEEEGNFFIILR